ncbi:MAG: hypothetical protein WD648_05730 [Planctomycetaceae bacterium]
MSSAVKVGSVCALVIVPLVLASCGGTNNPQPVNAKKTIPVRGEVYIDGKPGYGVKVNFVPKSPDAANPTVSVGESGEDGKFEIGTYGTNDGAPAGEYVLTFVWFDRTKIDVLNREESAADQFSGKYADPKNSKHSVTVPEDATEVEIPRIELTTQ